MLLLCAPGAVFQVQPSESAPLTIHNLEVVLVSIQSQSRAGQDIQQIADDEQRTITQVCEMLLHEGVEAYKREEPKPKMRIG